MNYKHKHETVETGNIPWHGYPVCVDVNILNAYRGKCIYRMHVYLLHIIDIICIDSTRFQLRSLLSRFRFWFSFLFCFRLSFSLSFCFCGRLFVLWSNIWTFQRSPGSPKASVVTQKKLWGVVTRKIHNIYIFSGFLVITWSKFGTQLLETMFCAAENQSFRCKSNFAGFWKF